MAYGIWTRPVGPGPAAASDIYIDSNSTFPQFKNRVSGNYNFNGGSRDFPISGWDGSGQIVVVPTGSLCWQWEVPPNLVPDVYVVSNISIVNNSTFRVSINMNPGSNPLFDVAFNVYQIWPRANRNYGITFSNTADYFSISDAGVVGQCIWAWEGNINGSMQVPAISGFDMSRASVFANWSGGQGLLYDAGSRNIRVYQNRTYDNGNNNQTGTVNNVRVAVFCDGAGVPTHNGGLNIYSPNGSQCVFSTYRTPFMVDRFMAMSGGDTGLSYPMIPLTNGAGSIRGQAGSWYFQHARSHIMNGSSFGTGYGRYMFQWSRNYDMGGGGAISLQVPVLDARKIFRSIQ